MIFFCTAREKSFAVQIDVGMKKKSLCITIDKDTLIQKSDVRSGYVNFVNVYFNL